MTRNLLSKTLKVRISNLSIILFSRDGRKNWHSISKHDLKWMSRENLVSISRLHGFNILPTPSAASVSPVQQAATDAGRSHGDSTQALVLSEDWASFTFHRI